MTDEGQNQLQTIVQDSGLENAKAQTLLDQFQGYFEIAAEWEQTAKTIVVTDDSQTDKMALARRGRLLLKEKRVAVERRRKELKEQSLREGKAIDGIANILRALIVPIEEHLNKQEKFVEIRAAEAAKVAQIEAERKAEEERLAQEEAERQERERMRLENERLKKEAEEKERKLAEERAEVAKREVEARAEAEAKIQKIREESERQQREAAEKQAKIDAERKAAEAEAAEKLREEREERERLRRELAKQVECPKCHHRFTPGGE